MRHWYLIYDDKCEICNAGIGRVRKLDKSQLIKLVPLSDPQVPPSIKLPSREALNKHMHLFSPDGKIFKGADALSEILKIFPESKMAGWATSFPLFRPIARFVYSIVAKNRMKLSKLISSH
ncbi:MAG TPA: DUF393 domain-containing protein [candidate division Zixibacteria bacterium]|nr:DUF393 domain-containing protein [candidate division Zixibacteria bacterium]